MQPVRIAVRLYPATDSAGRAHFRATLPMGVLFEKSLDTTQIEQERAALEKKYHALVETLRSLRPALKAGNVLYYWEFGDAIVLFERETSDSLLFVDKLSEHLARDVNYSMIDLCRRFRLKIPDKNQIDTRVTFAAYHRSGFDLSRAQTYRYK